LLIRSLLIYLYYFWLKQEFEFYLKKLNVNNRSSWKAILNKKKKKFQTAKGKCHIPCWLVRFTLHLGSLISRLVKSMSEHLFLFEYQNHKSDPFHQSEMAFQHRVRIRISYLKFWLECVTKRRE
jgi:hypothetical protein